MSNLRRSRLFLALLSLGIGLLVPSRSHAQVAGATLSGTVKDASGAILPGAQISITNVATGVVRRVTSDGSGLYVAPNLLPGTYQVNASAQGFSTQLIRGVLLTVGAQKLLDINMQPGQVTQEVEVKADIAQVDLSSATITGEVNQTTVQQMPLNGRSWTDLALLQPGVVGVESHISGDLARGFGSQVTVSGSRPQSNNYRIDGISINDYSNGGPGSILGGNLGVDAIHEFSVMTTNYSAEYGKTAGGVVNAITRSGTNTFHGAAYEFLRNSALDAKNYFDQTRLPFKRNQFGLAAGGPLKKDRSFIFGDYEGIRQSLGQTTVSTVLSPNARAGNLSTGTVPVDPIVAAYLGLVPLPNAGLIGSGDLGKFDYANQQVVNENFFTFRVDQKSSDKDSMFGTYTRDNAPLTQPDAYGDSLTGQVSERQYAALEDTHVYPPSFVNTIRVGWNRDHTSTPKAFSYPNKASTSPDFMWSSEVGSAARVRPFGGFSGVWVLPTTPAFETWWDAYQLYDDALISKGAHSIAFGGAFENDQMNQITSGGDYLGIFSFASLSDFLQNKPKLVTGALPGAVTPRHMRTSIFGAYVQDDWRALHSLMLNLGVRYEMSTVPSETNGKLTNLPTISAASPRLGGPYFQNPTLKDFTPRFGFAWSPFKKGETAVRGGFGIFDVLPLLYTTITLNGQGAPFYQDSSSTALPQGSFPNTAINYINHTKLQYGYVDYKPKLNYVMQWNLNIQQQLMPTLSLMVAYVGSHGVHMQYRIDDANMVMPVATSAGYVWPNPIGSGTTINPNVGSIRYLNWNGESLYHALQAEITKEMSHGLQFQASFSWGKSIDNNSGAIAGDTLDNSLTSEFWPDLHRYRAVSDFNIPRALVLNGTWMAPPAKHLGWAGDGWQLGGIFKVQDGYPFTPLFGLGSDPLGLNSTDPFDYPNFVGGKGCSTPINRGNPNNYVKTDCFAVPTAPNQTFYNQYCDPTVGNAAQLQCFNLMGDAGRNSIYGPGLANLDLSVFKNNKIKKLGENFNVQFRAEMFNILNRANFDSPINGTDIFTATGDPDPTAGLITDTTTAQREIQFGLKLVW